MAATPGTSRPATAAPIAAKANPGVAEVLALLAKLAELATAAGRTDLLERGQRAAERLQRRTATVLVVGEFKQGKSTLVNALLNVPVCGVADDVATVVPTSLRFGDTAAATVVYQPVEPGGEERREEVPIGAVAEFGTEQGNHGNRHGIRAIEVCVPRKLLEPGLTIVDTPGVGGLDSSHGAATYASLGLADVVLFVSDASQPLTRPELEFLDAARLHCSNVICVVTKTDIHPQWRKVVGLIERSLADRGSAIDVVAVSSLLRQRASADNSTELNHESGFPPLIERLRNAAGGELLRLAVRTAASDALHIVDHLETSARHRLELLEHPESFAEMQHQLEAVKTRADALRAQSAKWQQTLNDGVQDLTADLDHDLRMRIRTLLTEAEKVLDEQDPLKIWDQYEDWLHQRLAWELAGHQQLIGDRADRLTSSVADHFVIDEAAVGLDLGRRYLPEFKGRRLAEEIELKRPSVSGNALAAARGSYGGLLMFGMAAQMVGLAMLNPITIVVGLGLGRKSLRDEKVRQLTQRRQQAKLTVRKYVDDVSLATTKAMRDVLRNVHRDVRNEFSARAETLQTTIRESLRNAEILARQAQAERDQELLLARRESEQLAQLTRTARRLAGEQASEAGR